MIKYLIEDLKLALNENIYTHEINKNKTEEIKESIDQEEKGKNKTSFSSGIKLISFISTLLNLSLFGL